MDICDFRFARLYGVESSVCVQCPQPHKSITLLDEASVNGTNKIHQMIVGRAASIPGRGKGFQSIFIHEPSHDPIAQSLIGIDIPCPGSSSKVLVLLSQSLMFWTVTSIYTGS